MSEKDTVLGVLQALNNFATTKINFAERFTCEVTFCLCLLTVKKRNLQYAKNNQ